MSFSAGVLKVKIEDDFLGLSDEDIGQEQTDSIAGRGSKGNLASYLQPEYEKFTRPPLDILPPHPKQQRDTVRNIPFLYTPLAKKAFSPTDPNRPNSADFRLHRRRRHAVHAEHIQNPADRVLSLRNSPSRLSRTKKKSDASLDVNAGLDQIYSSRLGSGRTSAPPMMMSMNDSFLSMIEPAESSSLVGMRESMEQMSFRTKKRIKKKTPDLFVLEAEQRAIEGQQKALEKEEFNRKRAELEIYLTKLAAQYNEVKKTRLDMEKQYAALQEQKAEVSVVEEEMKKVAADGHKLQQLQDLEAKLDYWTQALREEESYTKTLQHVQQRSATDRHTREVETADFLRQLQNHEHDLGALATRLQAARNEQAAAEKRVLDYLAEIDLYRERRDIRLNQRKREVHRLQLKDAALRRLIAEEEELNAKKNAVNLAAAQSALAEQRQKEAFRGALDEGFGRIMSVTGVRTVEELAESFIHREEKTGRFQAMLDAMKTRIDELTTTRQELGRQLLRVKFSGGANDAESDEVEAALRGLAHVRRRIAERRGKLEATEGLLIRARAGLQFLASKFTLDLRIDLDPPSEPVEPMASARPAVFADSGVGRPGEPGSPATFADGGGGALVATGGAAAEEEEEDAARRRAVARAHDPSGGAVALLAACADRLARVCRFLEVHTEGVPPQRLEDALTVSTSGGVLLRLDATPHNARVLLDDRGGLATARETARAEWADDAGGAAAAAAAAAGSSGGWLEGPVEDRGEIKARAERLVARRKKELAARFDEYGNEIIRAPTPAPAAPGGGKAAAAASSPDKRK